MKFYMNHHYYGGFPLFVAQAAADLGAELIAINGYALQDYPGDRSFIEGDGEYLFTLECGSHREACHTVDVLIRERARRLYQESQS